MSILVVGSVALDTVTTPFGKIERGLGGSAVHFSMAASYFTSVNLVGVVGADFDKKHLDFLKAHQIGLKGLKQDQNGRTFHWEGRYDFDLNTAHTIKTELNVFEKFNPEIPASLTSPSLLFLANIHPELQLKALEQMQTKPKLVALDTMNFWIEGEKNSLQKVLKKVDLFFLNEGEARLLTGESNLRKAANAIKAMGPQTVVIKLGEYGALLFDQQHIFSVAGLPIEEIADPTGAGDSFAGGFLGYLAQAHSYELANLKQAMILGSTMASLNVEDFSCGRLANLSPEDISERYLAFGHLSHFEAMDVRRAIINKNA